MSLNAWEEHYTKEKSFLSYPDENLLRLLKKANFPNEKDCLTALDLGCGSGRHLGLLREIGFGTILGMDLSFAALLLSKKVTKSFLVQNNNTALPLKNHTIDCVVAWGSLHYASKETIGLMIHEIHRILKNGGVLLATLRSSRDTYLRRGTHLGHDVWVTDLNDLHGSTVSFFQEEELQAFFSLFNTISIWLH